MKQKQIFFLNLSQLFNGRPVLKCHISLCTLIGCSSTIPMKKTTTEEEKAHHRGDESGTNKPAINNGQTPEQTFSV